MPLRILHLSYRLLQPFFIPGDQYHYGPHLATIYRTLPTDTGRSTCHDDQFIFQRKWIHHTSTISLILQSTNGTIPVAHVIPTPKALNNNFLLP